MRALRISLTALTALVMGGAGEALGPRGDYSLFLLNGHGADGWQLIVNHGTGQWGTDRDAA